MRQFSPMFLRPLFMQNSLRIEKFKDEQGLAAETYDQISLILASIFEESKKCIEVIYYLRRLGVCIRRKKESGS